MLSEDDACPACRVKRGRRAGGAISALRLPSKVTCSSGGTGGLLSWRAAVGEKCPWRPGCIALDGITWRACWSPIQGQSLAAPVRMVGGCRRLLARGASVEPVGEPTLVTGVQLKLPDGGGRLCRARSWAERRCGGQGVVRQARRITSALGRWRCRPTAAAAELRHPLGSSRRPRGSGRPSA